MASRKTKTTTAKKASTKKGTAKKTATKTKAEHKADNATRSGLVDVPDSRTGKNLRRLIRAGGIRMSDRPDIGKVAVKVSKDGLMASCKIDGTTYETATEKGRTAAAKVKGVKA